MKAKDIQRGDVFKDDCGVHWTVSSADPAPGGQLMVTWRGGHGDWTLYHPEEDVGEPVQRARGHTTYHARTHS